MFKSLVIYKMNDDLKVDVEELAEKMPDFKSTPCSGSDIKKSGWIETVKGSEELPYSSNGQTLLTMLTEEKMLPSSVIKEEVEKKIERFEEREGRKPKKTEKDSFKDEVIQELLPRAFSRYNQTKIWINNAKKVIMVEAGSAKKAEDALALLRKTLDSLPVTPFSTETPIEITLTSWIKEQVIPDGFTVLDEAELKAVLEGGVLTSKKEDLFSDEIKQHIEAGKVVTKLALDWQEKVSFAISEDGLIKKIKFADAIKDKNSDIDKEDKAQRFDADFVLFTSTLSDLFDEIQKVFGGAESE